MATASNAFQEIAPTSTSASTSKAVYDVFINHRGPDTKHTLAYSIYTTLRRMGLNVFLDVEALQLGDVIPSEIQEAMSTSFLHIAILSPNYAQSPWCLAELAFMLKTGSTVIPVFYHVDPSDARYLKGSFADAFTRHEENKRYSPEKLQDWKEALQKVSCHNGETLKGNGDEGRLLKSIVKHIMKKSNKISLISAKHSVGLDGALKDFEENVLKDFKNVQIVGIVGMGGSGKTTLAKEIYNKKLSSIYKCSFVFDIREAAANNNLHFKQKRLMEDVGFTDFNGLSFDNVETGKTILKCKLSSLQVLIVLDDIDHQDQLDALLPVADFGCGSLIIVTSREEGILQSWGISSIYKMKKLNPGNAEELLCWHAFLEPFPPNEFQDLVQKFVKFCGGLPLSLKVFGGLLHSKSKEYWESQLRKASRILPRDIKERLKISFDALDEEEQEIFLDIACFFIGEEKNLAITVWDGSEWDGMHSWEVLENKCLVEVDEHNHIKMHDQLRDLGKEIAKGRSPVRVWSTQQITDILKQTTEKVLIRGIKAASDDFYKDSSSHHAKPYEVLMELVKDCSTKFKVLTPSIHVVKGSHFTEELAIQFPALLWLRWINFPDIALPSWLRMNNLRVLELQSSSYLEELWNNTVDPPLELRELNLEGATNFLMFPSSIGCLKHLKKISLTCRDMSLPIENLPEEFCQLGSLEYLQLSGCVELTSLPSNFGNLTNLRHLDLSDCLKLTSLPSNFGNLTNLRDLNLSDCWELTSLPINFGNLTNLRDLNLTSCWELTSLPSNFGNLTNLRHLDLSDCWSLRALPDSFKQLINLQHINLCRCKELSLTSENEYILEYVRKLESVNFSCCEKLQKLPRHITNQLSLRCLVVESTGLRELPSNIGELRKLETLRIGSEFLTILPTSVVNLSSLTNLYIDNCVELGTLPEAIGNLSSLTELIVSRCTKLKCLPESVGSLSSLSELKISDCTELEILPKSIGDLTSLTRLTIENCTRLGTLPNSAKNLSALTYLKIRLNYLSKFNRNLPSLKMLIILQGKNQCLSKCIGHLPSLHRFQIYDCHGLKHLGNSIGYLSSLTSLDIRKCNRLKTLPKSMSSLSSLTSLLISECHALDTLPESLGQLSSLTSLHISECHALDTLPESLGQLSSLTNFGIERCDKLKVLPESMGLSSSLSHLEISDCHELKTLPESMSHLSSLKYVRIYCCVKLGSLLLESVRSLNQLKDPVAMSPTKIQVLENCRSLETVKALTCWNVPPIQNLEHVEGLQRLYLSAACNISAFEPCLRTIKKWPSKCVRICARPGRGVESVMNSFAFPGLTLVDSCVGKIDHGFGELSLKGRQRLRSNQAAMVCFNITSISASIKFDYDYASIVGEGKWVWLGVFTEDSPWRDYRLRVTEENRRSRCVELGRGMLVMGERERIVEAFKQMTVTLGGE